MHISKKLAVILATGVASITVAGGAFAYFTATGSGDGSATVDSASPWLVTSGLAQGGSMAPGGFQQRVDFTVKNQSTGIQNLGSVVVSVKGDGTGAVFGVPGCLVSWFDIQQRPYAADPASPHSITLGDYSGGVSHTGSSIIQMNNGGSVNQDACAGKTIPLVVSAS